MQENSKEGFGVLKKLGVHGKTLFYKIVLFLVVCILLEVFIFNRKAILSFHATNQCLDYSGSDNIFVAGMEGKPGYLYVGVDAVTANGTSVPVTIRISIQDQGQSDFYELPEVTIYPLIEKSKYLALYSYGEVEGMSIAFETEPDAEIQIQDIIYDAKVPWFISGVRIVFLFGILCMAWCLRPVSAIYSMVWTKKWKRLAVGKLITVNMLLFLFLVRSNPAFLNPIWPYHQQYHQLAVALSQGDVTINVASEETLTALRELENPYDPDLRMDSVPGAGNVWDTCYYEGKFYVYFGIVPVLVFYLPYYLLSGSAFPTWLGVFLTGVGVIGGVYYLLGWIRRKWFPNISYTIYLLLAVISSNCLNLSCAMLRADFYYLPVLMALCFSVWGLGVLISAADSWEKEGKRTNMKLAAGALCMALTAGCRPQFLVGSFLIIPLFGPLIKKELHVKQLVMRILSVVLPYIVVAAGLMFYNYIRFGSVFDFGANYNLTTNDMTQRGFHLGRLPDGIFMYLFQPISCKLVFPFAEVTAFASEYMGNTIREWTFGGAFWTRPVLLAVFAVYAVKKELIKKKLYNFTLLSIGMSFIVVIADTEMAGILNRYYTDFLWLLMIPALIVLLQLLENSEKTALQKALICCILIAGAWSVLYEVAIAFRGSELIRDNAHRYYLIKSLFH